MMMRKLAWVVLLFPALAIGQVNNPYVPVPAGTQNVAPSSTLNFGSGNTLLVNTDGGATPVTSFSSTLPVGTIFMVRGWTGTNDFFTINTGVNIWTPNGLSSINVGLNCNAYFILGNLGVQYAYLGSSCDSLTASLTTTAATSNSVSLTGVTSASHCTLTPTNASAATNIATTYISAKASGSITVTHTATSGMTYDIQCSSY